MRAAAAACSLVLLASLSACGTETPEPGPAGGWTEQRIDADPEADSPVGLAADGEDVLVTVVGDDGTVRSHLSRGGGSFESGEPFATGGGYPRFADPVRHDGAWWLVGSGGLEQVDGDERLVFAPRVLRSEDGLRWAAVDLSGIVGPVEVGAVAVSGGALVVAGTRRPLDPVASEGFTAAVWRSEDGETWTEVSLPGVVPDPTYEEESHVSVLASSDERLLAGGALRQRAAVWASDDAGRSWRRLTAEPLARLYAVSGLVADGSTLVASGSPRRAESGSLLVRSDDAGETWAEAATQPAADGEGFAPLWTGGGSFFTVSRPGFATMADPAVCYADLEACASGGEADVTLVHHSDDGARWGVLDTPAGDEVVGVVGTPSGRVVLADRVRGGVAVHTWPGDDLPEGRAPAAPEPVDLVTVPEGKDPQPGVRYHAPLHVHCGMDWLYLGGTPWQRTDGGAQVETGAGDELPDGWPVVGETIYGFATLGEDGVVEYSVGEGASAEAIATYERTGVRPPGCD